jgi:hypothetical protein
MILSQLSMKGRKWKESTMETEMGEIFSALLTKEYKHQPDFALILPFP